MTAFSAPRTIAFYLPQFHPIPENDRWWGTGFTEWTNVTRAVPQYPGHRQPRLPTDLGFYDLRVPETRASQTNLARAAGISGFCYYYYWFAGKKLLDRPLREVVQSGKPDFPFCVCWANESWTRRWDGLDKEILQQQDYDKVEPEAILQDLLPILRDHRYLRVNGRPLLLVYRPEQIPDIRRWADRWKRFARKEGVGELYLCRVQAFSQDPPETIGFDAAVAFPPLGPALQKSLVPSGKLGPILGQNSNFAGMIADYRRLAECAQSHPPVHYKRFRTVIPSWDNTPRRGNRALILHGSTPEDYGDWLRAALHSTMEEHSGDERLVFINAWNEWAEGCHLEPDSTWNDRYLVSTRLAIKSCEELYEAMASDKTFVTGFAKELLVSRERVIRTLAAELRDNEASIAELRRNLAALELAARSSPTSSRSLTSNQQSNVSSLATAGKRPRSVIFGAGTGGERACRFLASDWDIVAFADNDAAKQGTTLMDRPVIRPDELMHYSDATIFLASVYADEINDQLLAMGIRRARIRPVSTAVLLGTEEPEPTIGSSDVIIFGASIGGRRAFENLPPECRVIAFADNDPHKAGLTFCDRPVVAPADMSSLTFDHVIVASMYEDEIISQLEELGIARTKIETVHPDILTGKTAMLPDSKS